jgi:hypothetical protein
VAALPPPPPPATIRYSTVLKGITLLVFVIVNDDVPTVVKVCTLYSIPFSVMFVVVPPVASINSKFGDEKKA